MRQSAATVCDNDEVRSEFPRRGGDLVVGDTVPKMRGDLRRVGKLLVDEVLEFGAHLLVEIRRRKRHHARLVTERAERVRRLDHVEQKNLGAEARGPLAREVQGASRRR